MSDVLQSPEFATWTKGPAALEKMKKVLSALIQTVWIEFLYTLSVEEKKHLHQFIEDANQDLVVANKKKKEWIFKCRHSLCQTLLEKLNAIRYNPKSMNIVWNTCCKPVQKGNVRSFNSHRNIYETFYWHIANMFMLYGSERNEIPSTGPEDTDVAMVLKMMKNCTLFEIDDNELYEKVINIRNRCFHTGSYNVSEQEMKSFIESMVEMLKGVSEMPNCSKKHKNMISSGIEDLREIAKRDVYTITAHPNWKSIAVKALEVQKQAIQRDILFNFTVSLNTDALDRILRTTHNRIQEFTDSNEWRQRQDEKEKRRRKEEEQLKEPLITTIHDLENLLEKERTETRKLSDENRKLEEKIRKLTTGNLAGEMSESGAQALNDFGPVGRAVGAVSGGAVGTVVEGMRKLFTWNN